MEKFKTKRITSEKLPLVIEATDKHMSFNEFLELLETKKAFFKENLLGHGGLLFRQFPVNTADEFASVIKKLDIGKFAEYIGGDSPRNKIADGVFTSTESPPWLRIPLHNELSFVKNYPSHISFFCQIAPKEKGETTIADARKILAAMNEKVKQRFIEKGIKYSSCYFYKSKIVEKINEWQPAHKSWTVVFGTSDKNEVERLCREHEFEYKWNKNDWIQISQTRPATLTHPIVKDEAWFNQAHLYDFNPKHLGWWRSLATKIFYFPKHMRLHEVCFGDGSPIPREDLYHVMDVLDANTIYFPWQKGDVLVLDNILSMHGRSSFSGSRRVLAAMTS